MNCFRCALRGYCLFGHRRLIIFKVVYFPIFGFRFLFIGAHMPKPARFCFCLFRIACIMGTELVVFDTRLRNWELLRLFEFSFFYVFNSDRSGLVQLCKAALRWHLYKLDTDVLRWYTCIDGMSPHGVMSGDAIQKNFCCTVIHVYQR